MAEQSWSDFGGVGLRWRRNATGLILGNRPALRIRTVHGHVYVVQCADPSGTAGAIAARVGPAKTSNQA
ncbi:hypothetical protein ACLBWP_11330 [Microbacterium sp. M1A1_1b]